MVLVNLCKNNEMCICISLNKFNPHYYLIYIKKLTFIVEKSLKSLPCSCTMRNFAMSKRKNKSLTEIQRVSQKVRKDNKMITLLVLVEVAVLAVVVIAKRINLSK